MNLFEVDNIELSFDGKEILKAIYFKAEKGKITGVLGKNGCGKTSLLRIIFGELIPNNKLIRIDKVPYLKSLYKYNFIKYLPQFGFIPKNISVKKSFDLFQVALDDFKKDFPEFTIDNNAKFEAFSGGETRLLETYLTLKTKSKIVLLDEPFSFIAPIYIEKVKEIIMLEKLHKIIVITDHFYKDILEISDSIYFLKDGYSKLIKTPEELIELNYINSL